MASITNDQRNVFDYVAFILTLIVLLHFSREQILKRQTSYSRAYSYLIVNNKKITVCFDDTLYFAKKLKARSDLNCMVKCLETTNNSLRGINYVKSSGSCSCLPKMDVWYNVTNIKNGCVSFFSSHSCPVNFDYVIENHKCYKLQNTYVFWNDARTLCNNFYSSHSVVIESFNENNAVRQYAMAVLNNLSYPNVCDFLNLVSYYGVWTAGYRTWNGTVITPFFWSPYPAQSRPMGYYGWGIGQPSGPLFTGTDVCIGFGLIASVKDWDDSWCDFTPATPLCELDIPM